MPYTMRQQPVGSRFVGLGLVILFHIGVIYALVNALAHKAMEFRPAPIETKILDEAKKEKNEPPPPPPKFAPPPPPFVPPPEVNVQTPAPAATTAIASVTHSRPVAPPAAVKTVPVTLDKRHYHEPDYPPTSRRLGEEGAVILQVLVNPDGSVADVKVGSSSGFDRLDQAAIEAVKNGSVRFNPGSVGGEAKQMWYTFRYRFRLS